ncbi:hypothetical protein SGPA1_40421 [Streptomyces misionensis JCM 4497]
MRPDPPSGYGSAAAAVVVEGVPVVSLVGVDVAGGRGPHRVAVASQARVTEVVLDVVGDAGVLAVVELVAVPVGVRAGGVAGLGAAGDVQGAAAGALEGLGALGGGQVELVERRTGRVVAVGAVAGRGPGDADVAEHLGRRGLADLGDGEGVGGGADDGDAGGDDEGECGHCGADLHGVPPADGQASCVSAVQVVPRDDGRQPRGSASPATVITSASSGTPRFARAVDARRNARAVSEPPRKSRRHTAHPTRKGARKAQRQALGVRTLPLGQIPARVFDPALGVVLTSASPKPPGVFEQATKRASGPEGKDLHHGRQSPLQRRDDHRPAPRRRHRRRQRRHQRRRPSAPRRRPGRHTRRTLRQPLVPAPVDPGRRRPGIPAQHPPRRGRGHTGRRALDTPARPRRRPRRAHGHPLRGRGTRLRVPGHGPRAATGLGRRARSRGGGGPRPGVQQLRTGVRPAHLGPDQEHALRHGRLHPPGLPAEVRRGATEDRLPGGRPLAQAQGPGPRPGHPRDTGRHAVQGARVGPRPGAGGRPVRHRGAAAVRDDRRARRPARGRDHRPRERPRGDRLLRPAARRAAAERARLGQERPARRSREPPGLRRRGPAHPAAPAPSRGVRARRRGRSADLEDRRGRAQTGPGGGRQPARRHARQAAGAPVRRLHLLPAGDRPRPDAPRRVRLRPQALPHLPADRHLQGAARHVGLQAVPAPADLLARDADRPPVTGRL